MKKELDVVAALIKKDGKVLLCQRNPQDHYGSLWEFPGGAVEKEESLRQAIAREIKEELGIEVKSEKLVHEFFDEDESLKIRIFLFSCQIISGEVKALDCYNFGFYHLKEAAELNLAPADKKIHAYLLNRKNAVARIKLL